MDIFDGSHYSATTQIKNTISEQRQYLVLIKLDFIGNSLCCYYISLFVHCLGQSQASEKDLLACSYLVTPGSWSERFRRLRQERGKANIGVHYQSCWRGNRSSNMQGPPEKFTDNLLRCLFKSLQVARLIHLLSPPVVDCCPQEYELSSAVSYECMCAE